MCTLFFFVRRRLAAALPPPRRPHLACRFCRRAEQIVQEENARKVASTDRRVRVVGAIEGGAGAQLRDVAVAILQIDETKIACARASTPKNFATIRRSPSRVFRLSAKASCLARWRLWRSAPRRLAARVAPSRRSHCCHDRESSRLKFQRPPSDDKKRAARFFIFGTSNMRVDAAAC